MVTRRASRCPNAIAPIEHSPELSAALGEAAPYLQDAGDIEAIVPTIRRLAAAVGPVAAATPEALHALLGVLHAGLRAQSRVGTTNCASGCR